MWIASERETTMGTSERAPKLQRERTLKWSTVIHSEGRPKKIQKQGRAKHSRCNRQAGQAHDEVSELRYNTLLSIGQRILVHIRQHRQEAQPPVRNGRANVSLPSPETYDKKSMREEVGGAGLAALAAGQDKSKTFRW
ncbi:hypothetical protein TRIATDRAFT_314128 [Trichoderma atroviride IMI 206040]|uniref:Uncharacterized protein n=2 Tax=Hypocrea atroviridis TaxID=63577 RepID=G9NEY8_HYPAI|nr:uncharacterized protein TRIATDRAFT_314128 [Trichoderma atroviride IMI 206040]EHK50507.1 hypothetical protein TRIATDRAFT_314128 [Trichoderma atroviride IMI 206040]